MIAFIIGLIIFFTFIIIPVVGGTLCELEVQKSKQNKINNLTKLALLKNNMIDIEDHIKQYSDYLSENQVNSLINRIEEIKTDKQIKYNDSLIKKRIKLLDKEFEEAEIEEKPIKAKRKGYKK